MFNENLRMLYVFLPPNTKLETSSNCYLNIFLVLVALLVEAHHGILQVSWIIHWVPQEPEDVPRRDIVVVVDEKVEARRGALLGRPPKSHHGLDGVVEVGVVEVSLNNVPVLDGFLVDLKRYALWDM